MNPRISSLAALFLLTACTGRHEAESHLSRQDSAGVAVVRLPRSEHLHFPLWRTRPLYSSQAWDSVRLGPVVEAVFTGDSSLIIAAGAELLRISPDGHFAGRIAREGDGPGEFRAIFRLGVGADGSLFAGDLWSGRLTQLTPTGKALRTIPRLDLDHLGRESEPVSVLADGTILATLWQWRPNRGTLGGIPAGALERDPVPLFARDETARRTDTLGLWPGLERARVALDGESRLPVPFARSAVYDGRGDATVIGVSDSLDLWLFTGTALRLRLIAPREATIPTAADRETWSAILLAERPDIGRVVVDAVRGAPEVPVLPQIGGVVVDDRGDLWVGDYLTPGQSTRRWRIYSPAGDPLGSVELPGYGDALLPSRTELLDVAGDRLALVAESGDGELTIEVRGIER